MHALISNAKLASAEVLPGIGIFYHCLPEKATFGAKYEVRRAILTIRARAAMRSCDHECGITSARHLVSSNQDNGFVFSATSAVVEESKMSFYDSMGGTGRV